MQNVGKWRWPVLTLWTCGVVGGVFQLGLARLSFEAQTLLSSSKGKITQMPAAAGVRFERSDLPAGTVRLIAQGTTPSGAVRSAEKAASALIHGSLDNQKAAVRRRIDALEKKRAAFSANLNRLQEEYQSATKGNRLPWTPDLERRLGEIKNRHHILKTQFPTHTDIPLLAEQIKALEARQRGGVKINRGRVADLSRKINEARAASSLTARRTQALERAEKGLQSDWKMLKLAAAPRLPIGVPGWPNALGSALGALLLGFFLLRDQPEREPSLNNFASGLFRVPASSEGTPPADNALPVKIPLDLADDEQNSLPDDPLTRKASALYEQWLALVKIVYAQNAEPPEGVLSAAEPLLKETAAFLPEGRDILARHLARVVTPGDLASHVARTVLIALTGAYEAGASPEYQRGMTFAALFHDLAVAPRPDNAWHEVGSEVGRLSSHLLRKIPGLPPALLEMVDNILIGMDEYGLQTWQNVARSEEAAPFARLLRQIDRFDKVMQKQKSRLTRRVAIAANC